MKALFIGGDQDGTVLEVNEPRRFITLPIRAKFSLLDFQNVLDKNPPFVRGKDYEDYQLFTEYSHPDRFLVYSCLTDEQTKLLIMRCISQTYNMRVTGLR